MFHHLMHGYMIFMQCAASWAHPCILNQEQEAAGGSSGGRVEGSLDPLPPRDQIGRIQAGI